MRSQTILIVDDEPANLTVLNQLLSPMYRIIACKSGEQALNNAEKEPPPDLILLDVMMPGMDGYEVMQNLRKNKKRRIFRWFLSRRWMVRWMRSEGSSSVR